MTPTSLEQSPKIAAPLPFGAENSNPEAKTHALVMDYLPLVRVMAWQIFNSLPTHAMVEFSDVVQAGHVGLVNASRSFQASGPVPFASYARYRIRGEILDSLRKLDGASRGLRKWQKRMNAETNSLTAEFCREPSEEEVCEKMGIGITQSRKHRLTLWYTSSCNSSKSDHFEADAAGLASVEAEDWRPDLLHRLVEMRQFLIRSVAVLPPRSRKVVLLYYIKELTMKQIGALLNINESRVSQIHKHALETLARDLRAAGVKSVKDL